MSSHCKLRASPRHDRRVGWVTGFLPGSHRMAISAHGARRRVVARRRRRHRALISYRTGRTNHGHARRVQPEEAVCRSPFRQTRDVRSGMRDKATRREGSPRYRSYTIHLRSTLNRNLRGVMARGIWRPILRASDATMSQLVEGGSKTVSTAAGSCRARYS